MNLEFKVEAEQEEDGRWIAEIPEIPGVLVYGNSPKDALEKVKELVSKVMEDRVANGEDPV